MASAAALPSPEEAGSAINPNLGVIRAAETDLIAARIPAGSRILELGGGSGYQARLLADRGYSVRSIDIDDPKREAGSYYPVEVYDGTHIPAEDGSYDFVVSSNVLEHIPTLEATLAEIRRILTPTGLSIHIVPSSVWRLATTMARYGFLVKVALGIRRPSRSSAAGPAGSGNRYAGLARKVLFESPHGVDRTAIRELYTFSGRRWQKVFRENGFEVVEQAGNGLFYTGYSTFPRLSNAVRGRLARLFGSSCHVFTVRPIR